MSNDFEFVDAHVHYWRPSVNDWYPGLRSRPIYRDILPSDFPPSAGHVHVSAVTAPQSVPAEAHWLEELRRETGLPTAVIGTIDPTASFQEIEAGLRIQAESAAFRGIRVFSGLDPAAEATHRIFRLLADHDWIFELITRPANIPAYLSAVERSPDTVFVLEHAGWPDGEDPQRFQAWRQAMALLASFDNVDCKISGLGMALNTTDPDRLRPFVETCLELFGVDRCFFGSNFPVDGIAGTYTDLLDAYRRTTDSLNGRDRHALFAANARRRYRIPG